MDRKRFSVVVLVILAGIAAIYLSAADPTFSSRPFNADSWKSGTVRTRGEMTADLFKGGFLKGKSRQEVVLLLGEGGERERALFYTIDMGMRLGFRPSLFEIAISFNSKEQVTNYEIVEKGKSPGI